MLSLIQQLLATYTLLTNTNHKKKQLHVDKCWFIASAFLLRPAPTTSSLLSLQLRTQLCLRELPHTLLVREAKPSQIRRPMHLQNLPPPPATTPIPSPWSSQDQTSSSLSRGHWQCTGNLCPSTKKMSSCDQALQCFLGC